MIPKATRTLSGIARPLPIPIKKFYCCALKIAEDMSIIPKQVADLLLKLRTQGKPEIATNSRAHRNYRLVFNQLVITHPSSTPK